MGYAPLHTGGGSKLFLPFLSPSRAAVAAAAAVPAMVSQVHRLPVDVQRVLLADEYEQLAVIWGDREPAGNVSLPRCLRGHLPK